MGCEVVEATGLGGGGKEGGGGGEITLSEYGRGLGGGRRFLVGFGWLPELAFSVSVEEVRGSSRSDLRLGLLTYKLVRKEVRVSESFYISSMKLTISLKEGTYTQLKLITLHVVHMYM